jgi:Tol biopolymer transport system component
MTTFDRFQDDLPVTLIELADERMPDYVDNLLGRTAASSQRPAWTFPGRWIPMVDLVADRSFVPRLPWRTLLVAALLALLVAGAVWFAGSQRHVPPPFGPARNGLIAYAAGGDIYAGDALSGQGRVLIGGPDVDSDPHFSPSGERLAFVRKAGLGFDLMVARADGQGIRKVSTELLSSITTFEWSADSTGIFVPFVDGDLVRLDADGGKSTLIAHDVDVDMHSLRPPDGREILFQRHGDDRTLFVMNVDGTNVRSLVQPGDAGNFNESRWSPDGSHIIIGRGVDPNQERLFVMNADGTGLRQLTTDSRHWYETDPVWSPDGTRVAFNRWLNTSGDTWLIQPIGVVTVATGALFEAGPAPVSDGSLFDWSPDGSQLLGLPGAHAGNGSTARDVPTVIDAATGTQKKLAWTVESAVSWQRVAP